MAEGTGVSLDPGYGVAPAGYRLPADARLGPVRLQVSDLERSLEYYQRVLGFAVLERAAGSAVLGPQGSLSPLIELHERPGARAVPRRGLLGLYHFAILLPDRAALGRFLKHLRAIGQHTGMSDHFVSEALYLTDPDGLGIEVYADRPRSAWRSEARQLVMKTDSLNVADLIQAAGEEEWTGMPAGTVVGHVHLFVGDLEAAEAFYHRGLGFDKVVWNYPGALFLSAGGYHHHLGTNTWAAGAPVATDEDARLLDWSLIVPDEASEAARSLRDAGFPVQQENDVWIATDPWGTKLRLI